ncbi:MliC family protein [Endozoicomonas sp.]|uniref:MliC family protein n=1 Tax=Endozoicomonas sp. TaxID=1892382 RepID=UPI0028866E2B|nr:MliC family protein [Endozoicomonas sp.]
MSAVVLTGCTALSEKQSGKKGAADKPAISSEERHPAVTLAYDCENGFHFTTSVEGDPEGVSARVFLPGETVRLPVVVSASGARFSNGKVTYWSSKDEALLAYNGKAYKQCRVNRKQTIWEAAKLRGVDFRAVGNEPGWTLEIRNSEQIVFITNYGEDRYTFPAAEPVSNAVTRTTEYKASAGGHALTIILEGKPCDDTMVDESYPITATIQFDGRRYRGCGMPLHFP